MKIRCQYSKLEKIKELKPHPKNPNKHSKDQIERLAQILNYQGWRYPVKVSLLSGHVTSGHGRIEAARKNGWKEVPISLQEYDNEEQEYADIVSDNAIAEWSELDLSGINSQLENLGPDFDIDLLGIKDFELEAADKYADQDLDDAPEPPKEAKTVLGDLYELGSHRLLCGDSTGSSVLERLFESEKASVWLSDPPYGINHVEVSQEKGQSKGYSKIENDDLQDEEFKEFILSAISASLPFMKEGFAFYMWHAMKMQGYTAAAAAAAAAAAGILFHRQIIWVKPQFVFGRGHYHWKHELCLMGWLKGNEPEFYGERNQSTIWEVGRENDKIHPTQKPVAIWEPSILNHTKRDEIIYEPFCGSGSNLVACEKTSRRCFAVELSPQYCDVIVSRWVKMTGITKVIRNGEEIEWETTLPA